MPNPTGKNQYSKGGGRAAGLGLGSKSLTSKAKKVAKTTSSHPAFSLDKGTSSAVHQAFIRQGLAKQAARKKAKKATAKKHIRLTGG